VAALMRTVAVFACARHPLPFTKKMPHASVDRPGGGVECCRQRLSKCGYLDENVILIGFELIGVSISIRRHGGLDDS